MPIDPLVQRAAIDVEHWMPDSEFAVFPQGAREKEALFAPDAPALDEGFLIPGRRDLFKRSRRAYPDQFWAEVVAYRLGCLLGVQVPPAFAGVKSASGECGAVIQWFYVDEEERFVWAGDLLQSLRPGFERERGTDHNLAENLTLLRALRFAGTLDPNERAQLWWARALAFDALIGNTDRHQDNWGLLYRASDELARDVARLAPLFDNGTSLGFERFPERVATWTPAQLDQYIARGHHHVRAAHGQPRQSHLALLTYVIESWPRAGAAIATMFDGVTARDIEAQLLDLLTLNLPQPLSEQRFAFMLRLLSRRLEILKELF